jgi:rubredoxin
VKAYSQLLREHIVANVIHISQLLDKMLFIISLVALLLAQANVQAFTSSSRFQIGLRSTTARYQPLKMSSSEPQIKVTEIFLSPKVEEEIVVPNYDNETEEERYKRTKLAEIAEKQALEVFVSRNTGKWECQSCGYVYAEDKGNEKYNIKAGTPFDQIEKFRCPQVRSSSFTNNNSPFNFHLSFLVIQHSPLTTFSVNR